MRNPSEVFGSEHLPDRLPDAELIERYRRSGGNPEELIYLSLGESWTGPPTGLREALSGAVPEYAHGYTLSPYGFPALRDVLRRYIVTTHDLLPEPDVRTDYEVAVSSNGTRDAMFDFGRLLCATAGEREGDKIALLPNPGWDYSGVFEPLGFRVLPYDVSEADAYRPDVDSVVRLLDVSRKSCPRAQLLLVLNPQHNPTGADWGDEAVRQLIRAALRNRVALLIDDAFYAVYDPDTVPTNTVGILLAESARSEVGSRFPWLAVRTLGKQFHCNGWGIGALTAHPETLRGLVRQVHHHAYGAAVPLQAAIAGWMADPASVSYLEGLRCDYTAKRTHVARRLVSELGYPEHAGFPGCCTSYVRLRVPERFLCFSDPAAIYRGRCLHDAGVLFGEGSMVPEHYGSDSVSKHVRLYLGPKRFELDSAVDRILDAGLSWIEPTPTM
ncbi:N-succinyldiaminopimelate aminotransferase [Actinopolyspora lacussalsi]|nr:N-succinyldiaminopimelate aminotransferase [Actinopolyspora lacussalsi]